MSLPDTNRLFDVLDTTWPAARTASCGAFTLKFSDGGGKRVTAARLAGAEARPGDVAQAQADMRAAGQTPLFQIQPGQDALDAALAAQGYAVVDETCFYICPLDSLLQIETPRLGAFATWPPLAIMEELWAEAGIGPDRVAVMRRCAAPHHAILGREDDRAAGVGFVACDDRIAMVHALEVQPDFRRRGIGARMMGLAAQWAQAQGATHMAVLVTTANAGACALYDKLGMTRLPGYHYRIDAKE